ncbi:MAG: LptE family protein [Chryseolinea sp.]
MTWRIKGHKVFSFAACLSSVVILISTSCGVRVGYSLAGSTTTAKTLKVAEFYNNTDLGQANIGQTFTNQLKNYFIQNSSLAVVGEDGELSLEGEVSDFRVTPIAPVPTNTAVTSPTTALSQASSTRLTITVKVTYVNTTDESMSFTDKSFSFYKDFANDQNITDIQESYTRQIFDRIVNDIFNATVANW